MFGCGTGPIADAIDASIEADATKADVVATDVRDECISAGCPGPCAPPFVPGPTHDIPEGGVCTDTQIDGFFTSCFGDGGGCGAFQSANAACVACLDTKEDAGTWGALVRPTPESFRVNVAGCLTKTSPDASCGAAAENAYACPEYACNTLCGTVIIDNDPPSIQAHAKCVSDARKSFCATWTKTECVPSDAGPTAACAGDDFEQRSRSVAKVLCGN